MTVGDVQQGKQKIRYNLIRILIKDITPWALGETFLVALRCFIQAGCGSNETTNKMNSWHNFND